MEVLSFPPTIEEFEQLYRAYVCEETDDEDAFTSNETKDGGRSYFVYGKVVAKATPKKSGGLRLSLLGSIDAMVSGKEDVDSGKLYSHDFLSEDQLRVMIKALRETKNSLFRQLIEEEFGCCNDFVKCSDAKACLHPHERFYNGCIYRKNLEEGRIFYGKNRNID